MKHFASLESEELLIDLKLKNDTFDKYMTKTGQFKQWKKAYDLYYGKHVNGKDGHELADVGDEGELSAFGVNHFRNLVKHVMALTCSQKPSYDFRAVNSDQRSMQQARLANNILDQILVEKRMGRHMKTAAEISLVFKVGYTYTKWDPSLGRPYSTQMKHNETGEQVEKIVYEGEPAVSSLPPWRVKYDPRLKDWTKNKWGLIKSFENKFDLGARHPELSDRIEKLKYDWDKTEFSYMKDKEFEVLSDIGDELVPIYEFYHLPTDAVPNGRYMKYAGDIVLSDGGYQYRKKLPIHRITPSEDIESVDGYTEFVDIMVLQTVVNILYAIPFNNQQAFGVQAIHLPDGCNLTSEQIGKGLVVLKGGPPGSEPKPIQLTASPAEVFKNIEFIEKAMEKLSGVNSVIRGDPEAGLKSGVALGRLQAMAIQFSSNFQQSWAELQEDVGTFILYMLQDFAQTERMVAMAGKHNKGSMQSFVGKDIDLIDRVVCDLGNPLARVYAGRMEMAEKLLDKGLIKSPDQYFNLINTGNLDSITEGPTSELELVRRENEELMDGRSVKSIVGDKHIFHSQEHRVILSDPTLRAQADAGDELAMAIVQNTLAHIEEHKRLHLTQDPFWFGISGESPPPPPPMMPPGPPPGEGPPPGPQGPGMPPPPGPMGPMGMAEPPPIPPIPPEMNQPPMV